MTEKKPLISVIVPVYNGETYLKNCIDSIRRQTYEPLEILLVNDGSTDGTAAVCDQIRHSMETDSERTRTIQVITLGDEGVSVARNTALSRANGAYISFVDADDRILPDMIEHLYQNLIATGSQISGCSYFAWEEENQWTEQLQKEQDYEEPVVFSAEAFRKQIFNRNSRCWSKLYDAEVLKAHQILFDKGLTIGEDMLFLAKLTDTEARFCESSYQGYAYYQNQAGAMNRKFNRKTMDQITCWKKVGDMFGRTPKSDSIVLINTLLVLGRIAELPAEEISQYRSEIRYCQKVIKEYAGKAAVELLTRGYQAKVCLAGKAPNLYVKLYHLWKKA